VNAVQTRNGVAMLRQVALEAKARKWGRRQARRVAQMCCMCVLDESSMYVYANVNNQASVALPHDAVGHDHASVGMFQQQVPGWGTTAQCMSIPHSTASFLQVLEAKGYASWDGPPLWQRIQGVQISAVADGSNYKRYVYSGWWFAMMHYGAAERAVR
jgi:hypothetical protein